MENTQLDHIDSLYYSSVTWKIYNYLNGPLEVDIPIESSEFVTTLCHRIKWKLALTGRRKVEEQYVTEVSLKRSPCCSGPEIVDVKVRIAIVNRNGKVLYNTISDASLAANSSMDIRCSGIFQDILDCIDLTLYNTETIRIRCDFLHDAGFTSNIDTSLKELSDDLKKLNMTGFHSDCSLKIGEDTFPVHSAILKARSPYIARILKNNPKQPEINLIQICSYSQLSSLITYWYSGDLENIPRMQSPPTINFILNTQQLELRRYIDPENTVISTTFDILCKRVNWIIENFKFCENLNHLKESANYKYRCEEGSWKLCFYPNGISGDSDYFTLNIEQKTDSGFLKYVNLEVFMYCVNGKEYGNKSTISALHTPGQYPFENFMTHKDFVKVRDTLQKNGVLSFGCRIIYGSGCIKKTTSSVVDSDIVDLPQENPYTTLAKDYENLLKSGDSSDVDLNAGDKTFKVHKAILAARSRYFDWMFRNDETFDSEPYKIKLDDIEPENLENILKYMYYAEKLELNPELAVKLYPVFSKYKITGLENLCSDYLQSNISASNVLNILDLADKNKDLCLKIYALNFIKTLFSDSER